MASLTREQQRLGLGELVLAGERGAELRPGSQSRPSIRRGLLARGEELARKSFGVDVLVLCQEDLRQLRGCAECHRVRRPKQIPEPMGSSSRRCLNQSTRGATLRREELLNEVWGYHAMPSTRTVDVPVAWLRQKIEPNPRHPQFILTVHGMGYKFAG